MESFIFKSKKNKFTSKNHKLTFLKNYFLDNKKI